MTKAAFDGGEKREPLQLPTPIDHVLVTGPGLYYAGLLEFDFDEARHDIKAHLLGYAVDCLHPREYPNPLVTCIQENFDAPTRD